MSLTYGTEGSLRVGQQAPDFTATAVVDQESASSRFHSNSCGRSGI